ncbi:hypothetical protein [Erythrobacter aureus]|uniref:hypothetical protein n=1 Tax=Erythrobacter aureus TaxID=2182384 RepID=UPI0013B422B2|nr:hypothetical protein [Erythrobacter aureus]
MIRKSQVAALTLVREMREMFIAIAAHGTPLPSSSDTEFFALEHDSRRMRFFFNEVGDILVSLERPTRGLFLQMPNLKDINPRSLTEDEISAELHASFALLDGIIENSRLIDWHAHGASPTFPDIESCDLEGIPGVPGLISGTLKFAMAAIRRELPTLHARMTAEGQMRRPHLSLDSDPDTEELSTLLNHDGVALPLFETPIHANRFVLPQMFGITGLGEDHLRVCRIPTVRFCPELAYDGSVEDLDRAYDLLGAAMPLAPRTSIEARQHDITLGLEVHMDDDFDTILDVMDVIASDGDEKLEQEAFARLAEIAATPEGITGSIEAIFGSATDPAVEPISNRRSGPPENFEALIEDLTRFVHFSVNGETATDYLLSLNLADRTHYYLYLKLAISIAKISEENEGPFECGLLDLITREDYRQASVSMIPGDETPEITQTVEDGVRAYKELLELEGVDEIQDKAMDAILDDMIKAAHPCASDEETDWHDPRASVESIDEALTDFAGLGDGETAESVVNDSLTSLFAKNMPADPQELADRISPFLDEAYQQDVLPSVHLMTKSPPYRLDIYLCFQLATTYVRLREADLLPPARFLKKQFPKLLTVEKMTNAFLKMDRGVYDEEIQATVSDGLADYRILLDFLEKDELANAEPAGSA